MLLLYSAPFTIFAILTMQRSMMMKITYSAPECEYIASLWADLLCTSPDNGGVEGIGYEDWTD